MSGGHITWTEEDDDKLLRVEWSFWLMNSCTLVLDRYQVHTRPTRRHAYKVTTGYVRLPLGHIDASNITESMVPWTEAVRARALEELTKKLRIVRWSEVPR